MKTAFTIKPSREKARAYQRHLRRQGLRPIEIWVPDVHPPEFAAETHRQSLAVANNPHAKDDQELIDRLSE